MNRPVVLIGNYGVYNSAQSNYEKIADDIAASNFTGSSIFLLNSWTQVPRLVIDKKAHPIYPWVYMPATMKFDLKKANDDYYERLTNFLELHAQRGLDVELCFFDVYYRNDWKKFLGFKPHPFRDNNIGVSYGDSAKPIYDSITFAPLRYYFLRWEEIAEGQLKWKWFVEGEMGAAIEDYIDRTIEVVAKILLARKKPGGALKYPKFRILWKSHNEQLAVIESDGHASAVKSVGDRSEIYAWISEKWKAAGCLANARFQPVVNRDLRAPDEFLYSSYRQLHTSITKPYGQAHGLGAFHESHLKSLKDAQDLISKSGFNPQKTLFSSDSGTPEVGAEFVKAGFPYVEVLFEERVPGNDVPVPPYRFQQNWDKAFPFHANLIK